MSALVAAPSDPTVVYAGFWTGIVFRSTDSGRHWSERGFAGSLYVYSLAVDAVHPGTVYAGTVRGLMKSLDAGRTWSHLVIESDSPDIGVGAVTSDPVNSGILYAATFHQILYKSVDAGLHWQALNSTIGVVDLSSISPADPGNLYVTDGARIDVSRNAGESWSRVTLPFAGATINDIAASPIDPSVILVSTGNGLYRTGDSGTTWSVASTVPGRQIGIVVFDPRNGSAYAAVSDFATTSTEILRSVDGGRTWLLLKRTSVDWIAGLGVASSGSVLAGFGRAGVFRSDDEGVSWTPSRAGLTAVSMTALASPPDRPWRIYAASSELGMYRSDDGGRLWLSRPFANLGSFPGASVVSVAIDPRDSATAFASGEFFATPHISVFSVWKSTDAGLTWERKLTLDVPIGDVVVDPADSSIVYAAVGTCGRKVTKSVDGGDTWSVPAEGNPCGFSGGPLAEDPSLPGRLYAASPGEAAGISRSDDGTETWTEVFADVYPDQIAVMADPSATVLASIQSTTAGPYEVWRSTDLGGHWLPVAGIPPVSPPNRILMAADPADASRTYVAAAGEVFASRDGGASWAPLAFGGLPGLEISALRVSGGRAFAATAAGVFSLDPVGPLSAPESVSPAIVHGR